MARLLPVLRVVLALVPMLAVSLVVAQSVPPAPRNMRTNFMQPDTHTFGIDLAGGPGLHLSWENAAPDAAASYEQASLQIQIHDLNGDLIYDTHEIVSSFPGTDIPNVAAVLAPAATYAWQVRVKLQPATNTSTTTSTSTSTSPATPTDWSPYSAMLLFDTAPRAADFAAAGAAWIGGFQQLKGSLSLPSGGRVQRARVYCAGVGAFKLRLNGQAVSDSVLDPPQSTYFRRVYFATYDITAQVQVGAANTFEADLGNVKWGYLDVWCNMTEGGGPDGCRALVLMALVDLDDGSRHTLVTSPQGWLGRQGPILWDHFFHGETYNASLETAAASDWSPAKAMPDPPTTGAGPSLGPLHPAPIPPIREVETFDAVAVRALKGFPTANEDSYIFDFGQNMGGYVELDVPAGVLQGGDVVRIAHAEIVHGDTAGDIFNTYCSPNAKLAAGGSIRIEPCAVHQTYPSDQAGHIIAGAGRYQGDFNDANMTNIYIVAPGGGPVRYKPSFAAAGFRFARVSVPAGRPALTVAMARAHFLHTDVRSVGAMQLGQVAGSAAGTPDLLNRIHNATRMSALSNLMSVPTDCPQRERRGWMGDAQISSEQHLLAADMQAFYWKFLQDIRDDQLAGCSSTPGKSCPRDPTVSAGSVADVSPFDGIGGWPGCGVWQVALTVIGYNAAVAYNDMALLKTFYDAFKDQASHFERNINTSSGLLETDCYGDWVDITSHKSTITPASSVTAFYFVYATKLMAEIAAAVGNTQDAQSFQAKFVQRRQAYIARYYSETARGFSPVAARPRGSMTSNAMALALDLEAANSTVHAAAVEALQAAVQLMRNHSSGGIVGQLWVLRALSDNGLGELGLEIMLQDDWPSIGRMVSAAGGQTTLCETWNCTVHDAGGGSLNHIMFGGFHGWMYHNLAGLAPAPGAMGWQRVLFQPLAAALPRLGQGEASIETVYGQTAIRWVYDQGSGKATADVTVPVGAEGRVVLPTRLPTGAQISAELGGQAMQIVRTAEDGTELGTAANHFARPCQHRRQPALCADVGSGRWRASVQYV